MAQSTIPTMGLDLGDRFTHFCLLPVSGEDPLEEGRVRTTPDAVDAFFRSRPLCRVVLEVGTHSPWLSRLAEDAGHETFVANPRELAFIYGNIRKCDGGDAERLARVGRLDPKLLSPIRHRGEEVQRDLLVLRARDVLVSNRTRLVNAARGLTKALGSRISGCSAASFAKAAPKSLPADLTETLSPLLDSIEETTQRIRGLDRRVEGLCATKYTETGSILSRPGEPHSGGGTTSGLKGRISSRYYSNAQSFCVSSTVSSILSALAHSMRKATSFPNRTLSTYVRKRSSPRSS